MLQMQIILTVLLKYIPWRLLLDYPNSSKELNDLGWGPASIGGPLISTGLFGPVSALSERACDTGNVMWAIRSPDRASGVGSVAKCRCCVARPGPESSDLDSSFFPPSCGTLARASPPTATLYWDRFFFRSF